MQRASPQQLQHALVGRLEAIAELTEGLVELESPSSAGEGVAAVIALFEQRLRAIGFVTRAVDVGLVAPVLDAALEFGPGPTVLVLGHADTVWPCGTAADWRGASRERASETSSHTPTTTGSGPKRSIEAPSKNS